MRPASRAGLCPAASPGGVHFLEPSILIDDVLGIVVQDFLPVPIEIPLEVLEVLPAHDARLLDCGHFPTPFKNRRQSTKRPDHPSATGGSAASSSNSGVQRSTPSSRPICLDISLAGIPSSWPPRARASPDRSAPSSASACNRRQGPGSTPHVPCPRRSPRSSPR